MKKFYLFLIMAAGLFPLMPDKPARAGDVSLPQPGLKGPISVEEALKSRRTNRSFSGRPLSLEQLAQILWAAYGVTDRRRGSALKTAPSAGAFYPLDVYAVVGPQTVSHIEAGVYHYQPEAHALTRLADGDRRENLGRAALGQMWLTSAPAVIVITGEYARCQVKYGPRGRNYTLMESGCVAQNIFLQAEALGLKAGIIGAFVDGNVTKALDLPPAHEPLLILPVGYGRD